MLFWNELRRVFKVEFARFVALILPYATGKPRAD